MLNHLFDRYGNLTAIAVQECKNRINDPFRSEELIAVYFQRLEDEQQINNDRGVPISQAQLMQTALFAFYVSGIFTKLFSEFFKTLLIWFTLDGIKFGVG